MAEIAHPAAVIAAAGDAPTAPSPGSSPLSPNPEVSRLARILSPALEKVIKNAAWRKHSKLVQACKAVIDKLHTPPEASLPPQKENAASEKEEHLLVDGSRCFAAEDAAFILQPLVMACETGSLKVVEPALDAIQKLISHGHLHGEVDAAEDHILVQLLEVVCKCHDMGEDAIELLVLKTLLTAVTSIPLHVHGLSLLNAVRTCYCIYHDSKVVVNQTTAKASLIQMLIIVFRRMEADSPTVPVQPIVVADLMEPADVSVPDGSNITQFVQSFITKVVQDIEVALNPLPVVKPVAHEGAFETGAVEGVEAMNYMDSTDKDTLDVKFWELNMYKSALEERKGDISEVELERDEDAALKMTNKLYGDAVLVFTALCKLSIKASPQEVTDPTVMRGKIIALELLKIVLENAGEFFQKSDRFLAVIKKYLCLSLLKNNAASALNVFQLSCSIFITLISRFRSGLKVEINVFFPMFMLRVLENVAQPTFQHKVVVLRSLEKLCVDSQILVDIFVNYDCDVDSSNIFERMVNGLLKTAQGVPPGATTCLAPLQEATLKLSALKCLVEILRSMGDWMNKQLRITSGVQYQKFFEQQEEIQETGSTTGEGVEEILEGTEAHAGVANEMSNAATFEHRCAYNLKVQEGIHIFNQKPSNGIEFLVKANKIGQSPEEIATFLKNAWGLDKTLIGDYLGENEDICLKVMHAYVDKFNFQGMEFDDAIRTLLSGFRLPGEAQKIDRILEKFAERYCKCNPEAFTSADTAYVLAYSAILLNTNAHNPLVKNKMSKTVFLRINRGIDDGKDLPENFVGALYDRIVKEEIRMKAYPMTPPNRQSVGLDTTFNIVIRKYSEQKALGTSDEVIRHMQEQLKAMSGKSEIVYYAASDVEILRPMIEVSWAPMLAAFSVPLDQSEDEVVTFQCLEGFRHAVHLTAVMCMQTQRDAFLTSLAKFTSLHSAADIKQKNIDAIKAIISIADEDGNYLQEAWEHILTCVSRFEHLHLLGEGAPTDATFFAAPQSDWEKPKQVFKPPVLPALWRKGPSHLHYAATAAARRGSYDSAGVGGLAAGAVTTEQMNNLVSNLNMLEQVGSFEMNRIFTRSQKLNSEAVIDFVKALCKVSLEELKSPTDPRVFSLTKIVEIAHFNMNRIRLVWSQIWNVLSDFFISIGCSENLSIAIFAMDSLRQLAMKFLEREELANYNFQNEFMKPFVSVMRKSNAFEIRELIIRCLSQMVLVRVNNVKSGWKTMFMVFTIAATDDHKSIVLLAFETIEKIIRDYFPHITETETSTFTDCVNCLIAFTNSRFNQDVSLNAITFLRFCAQKLAEGELGGAGSNKADLSTSIDKGYHLYLWFPLLAGLSELSLDPRQDIRKSALDVLFDTLRFHGHLFSLGLWERVFQSVLFPIFDSTRRATDRTVLKQQVEGVQSDETDPWLYETCSLALQLLVDLFVKFYSVVNPLAGTILHLLTGFIKISHQSLAAIGIAAFVRLINNAGNLLSEDKWSEVLSALKEAALQTLPDLIKVAESAEFQAAQTMQRQGVKTDAIERVVGIADGQPKNSLQVAVSGLRSHTSVQLLIVQAVNEIYNLHRGRLTSGHIMTLLNTVQEIAVHSRRINGDFQLRSKLQKLQIVTQVPDPPLLRLENESSQAYLALLQRLPLDKPAVAKDVEVEDRMVELCEDVLRVYLTAALPLPQFTQTQLENPHKHFWIIPLGSSRRRELVSRGPLVVATLKAIGGLREDSSFEKYVRRFFPLLSSLISCEHGSGHVQVALSDMLSSWIGPSILRASCKVAAHHH